MRSIKILLVLLLLTACGVKEQYHALDNNDSTLSKSLQAYYNLNTSCHKVGGLFEIKVDPIKRIIPKDDKAVELYTFTIHIAPTTTKAMDLAWVLLEPSEELAVYFDNVVEKNPLYTGFSGQSEVFENQLWSWRHKDEIRALEYVVTIDNLGIQELQRQEITPDQFADMVKHFNVSFIYNENLKETIPLRCEAMEIIDNDESASHQPPVVQDIYFKLKRENLFHYYEAE